MYDFLLLSDHAFHYQNILTIPPSPVIPTPPPFQQILQTMNLMVFGGEEIFFMMVILFIVVIIEDLYIIFISGMKRI